MRILFLTHAFNSLAQRLFVDLKRAGHELSLELDINDAVTREAIQLFKPDVILAPFLKRAIPRDIFEKHLCLVVHPGIAGDGGPAALDWAILEERTEWGVTVLEANEVLDGGPIWATQGFAMRKTTKSSLYRNEVTAAASRAVRLALERIQSGDYRPLPPAAPRSWHPMVPASARTLSWAADSTEMLLRKIRSADTQPGALASLLGEEFHVFGAEEEPTLRGTEPGGIIGQRHGSICVATREGALWLSHLKRPGTRTALKLPATQVLGERLSDVASDSRPGGDLEYSEDGPVGSLHFPFSGGAMSTSDCLRLTEAFRYAKTRPTRVIVLWGGTDFWSNGIHLNTIEASASPAEESWRNINAMNDLVLEILTTESHLTFSAMRGNAGAGGCFLALAADRVLARQGIILNPHYRNMGNLHGSEYWTYLLPKRAGKERMERFLELRLPLGTDEALELGLLDESLEENAGDFRASVLQRARTLAASPDFERLLRAKVESRRADEAIKPLAGYREEELSRMKRNFFGSDPSYHVARYNFVYRIPHSRTRTNEWSSIFMA